MSDCLGNLHINETSIDGVSEIILKRVSYYLKIRFFYSIPGLSLKRSRRSYVGHDNHNDFNSYNSYNSHKSHKSYDSHNNQYGHNSHNNGYHSRTS